MFKKLKSLFATDKKDYVSEKDKATARGEAYVRVVNVNVDFENPADGYFELEWNQLFIRELLEAGYTGQSEEEIVDSWFTNLCRNIADEV
jgi:hypothetical protein